MRTLVITLVALVLATSACDKPTHDKIDTWRHTERGPGKLADALDDHGLDPDLRAHAAQALVSINQTDKVEASLKGLKSDERQRVMDKLVPRLWREAEIADKLDQPTDRQIAAKDALFTLRPLATDAERDQIDGYLADWLGGFYVGRQASGLHAGEKILRVIGARATPKLVAEARDLVEHPMVGNKMTVVPDVLLQGIALSGGADGIAFLMDLGEGKLKHPDETLPDRAINALIDTFSPASHPDGAGVAANMDRLVGWGGDRKLDGKFGNTAFTLIEAAGKPACLPALVKLAHTPEIIRIYKAVAGGVKCAGGDGVVAMAEALPTDRSYARAEINPNFWTKIVALGADAAGPARTLLGSQSWVARLTGVEVLAEVGTKDDADRVRKLAGDKTKLKGWWGDQRRDPDPTLGSEAATVADRLQKK